MHTLITGGAGFIGSHLAYFHLKRGDTVEIVDDLSTGSRQNMAAFQHIPRMMFHEADILRWKGLGEVVARADRIYHMAAIEGRFRLLENPLAAIRVDSVGTQRVLELAVKGGRQPAVVLPSSASVYGGAPPEQQNECASLRISEGPLANYMLNRLANEAQGVACHEQYGLPVVIARLFNITGSRQSGLHGAVLPRFVQQALSHSPITVFGNGEQTRSFCDVRDAIAMLHTLASCKSAYGLPVNVGNTDETTILQLARTVKALTGSSSSIEFVPFEKAYGQSLEQIPQRRPTLALLSQLTGYRHQWTLQDSIQAMCDHYRDVLFSPPPHATRPFVRDVTQPDLAVPVFNIPAACQPSTS